MQTCPSGKIRNIVLRIRRRARRNTKGWKGHAIRRKRAGLGLWPGRERSIDT